MTDELSKLKNMIVNEAEEGHVIRDLPYIIEKNIEFAADWEDYISNGLADELNEFVTRISKELMIYSVISEADVISFWGYVLYLVADRRIITNEEIAKLNEDLDGMVGDVLFNR